MFHKKKTSNARFEMARLVVENAAESENNEMMSFTPNTEKPVKNDALFQGLGTNEQIENLCICNRKPKTLICISCKMFTYGRVAEKCPEHLNVTFLMDFVCCPNCLGASHLLHGVDIDHRVYRDLSTNAGPSNHDIPHGCAS